MNKTDTLILEGGALRGVYTSGVLDALMELGIRIPNVVGVSAGSLNALSYLSRQPGRSRDINLNYVNDPRYMGPSHLLKTFSFFNFDFVFGELSHELVPFDYETFYKSEQSMWAVATDCRTGKAIFYHDKEMGEEFFTACRASCSMPLLCSMVKVGEDVCLDGGIASCIPLPEELPFPAGKLVVVLTRQKGFRKKGQGPAIDQMYRRRYKTHPQLMEACLHQAEDYNRRVRRIEELEQEGKAFVIRPQTPVTVTRTERDVNKLRALYQQGFDETMALAGALIEFLGIDGPGHAAAGHAHAGCLRQLQPAGHASHSSAGRCRRPDRRRYISRPGLHCPARSSGGPVRGADQECVRGFRRGRGDLAPGSVGPPEKSGDSGAGL